MDCLESRAARNGPRPEPEISYATIVNVSPTEQKSYMRSNIQSPGDTKNQIFSLRWPGRRLVPTVAPRYKMRPIKSKLE